MFFKKYPKIIILFFLIFIFECYSQQNNINKESIETMNNKDKWDAKYYKKHSEGQYKGGMDAIEKLNLKGNENILDIGCGDGRITAEIAKRVPGGYVFGIDVSQNMIDDACKSFKDIKNLEFKCVDVTKFSSDKKFDIAVSFSAFHWIKDQLLALKNIYNVLKDDGQLIIKMPSSYESPVSKVYRSSKWMPFWEGKQETFFPQTLENFSNMLKEIGFKNIDVSPEISLRSFESKEELFNCVFVWVPHSTGLPTDKAKEFTQDIVENVCAANKQGEIIWENRALVARAEK